MEETLTCRVDLKFSEYLKLQFRLLFRKPGFLILLVTGMIFLVFSLLFMLSGEKIDEMFFFPVFFTVIFLVFLPAGMYAGAKKNFRVHARLHEPVRYSFHEDNITVEGISYSDGIRWDNLRRVIELNEWFLFYQNRLVVYILPVRCLGNEGLEHLRDLVKSRKNLKARLKS